MGQFGPSIAGNQGIRRFADSGVYLAGALASSFAFGLLADALGSGVRAMVGCQAALLTALGMASGLLTLDALRVWAGRSWSFGPTRQTPYGWRLNGWPGVLAWGIDTGLPVTTLRATPLPFLGVILVVTGHASPLHGLCYGVGLTLGVTTALAAARSQTRIDRAMDRLSGRCRQWGPARLVMAPSVVVVAILAALAVCTAWCVPSGG